MSQNDEAEEDTSERNENLMSRTYGIPQYCCQYSIEVGSSPLICGSCHRETEPRLCTGCMVIAYCNRDCQRDHRKKHKRLCCKVADLRQYQKELRESSDFSDDLYSTPPAFKRLFYDNGLELANAMLAMAYHQTNFNHRRTYEIVLQQYMDLFEASEAAFYTMINADEPDGEVAPNVVPNTVILLLVALGRNDDAMTLLNTREQCYGLRSEGSVIKGEGDRLSAFEFIETYNSLNVVDHACLAIVRARVVADMKENESKYRAALETADRTEPINPELSKFLPERSYEEEMREQIRDIEYQAGWTQRNCDQFFTGLLLSERNPQSLALAKQEVCRLGLSRECFLLMRDCFARSRPVSQVMQSHVLNRISIGMNMRIGTFQL